MNRWIWMAAMATQGTQCGALRRCRDGGEMADAAKKPRSACF